MKCLDVNVEMGSSVAPKKFRRSCNSFSMYFSSRFLCTSPLVFMYTFLPLLSLASTSTPTREGMCLVQKRSTLQVVGRVILPATATGLNQCKDCGIKGKRKALEL